VPQKRRRIAAKSLFHPTSQSRGINVIKKVQGGYKVLSEKGKNLGGPYQTKKEAEKRLREVEYFEHK
jgi:hypothetical protein